MPAEATVNTVRGKLPADLLGVTLVHEALLSVLPGAQYAPDLVRDRAEVFDILAARLTEFRAAGGGAVVECTGMFHGRDLPLLEALSRSTGVHIVASTGLGPEELLGGYFLTPQTQPPTPWPAERFAALFGAEATQGCVVPRVERRAPAGLIATAVTAGGMTATDESLLRGAARAAAVSGVPLSLRFGADAVAELGVVRDAGLPADRVVVGGADRRDAAGSIDALVRAGAHVAFDHVGADDPAFLDDRERVVQVRRLVDAGHADRILLSAGAVGVGQGVPTTRRTFADLLTQFVPALTAAGLDDGTVRHLLVDNPAALLTVKD